MAQLYYYQNLAVKKAGSISRAKLPPIRVHYFKARAQTPNQPSLKLHLFEDFLSSTFPYGLCTYTEGGRSTQQGRSSHHPLVYKGLL